MARCSRCGVGLKTADLPHFCRPPAGRHVVTMQPGSAPILKFRAADELDVGVGHALRFPEAGRYILLPVQLWEQTLRKAMLTATEALNELAASDPGSMN